MRLGEIGSALGLACEGDATLEVEGLAGLSDAGPADLSFVTGDAHRSALEASAAGAVIAPPALDAGGRAVLRSAAPYAAFARAIDLLYPRPRPAPGVHPTAALGSGVELGRDVWIGAYAVLGDGVRIGDRTRVHPHVTLYDGVRVGADCELHAGACVCAGAELGDRVVVHPGAVIGSEGFGLTYDEHGARVRIPHVGAPVVGDGAQIGANTTIDASHPGHARHGAPLARTRIGAHVALDNQVHIGHGCSVGDHSTICARAALGGSTQLGRLVTLGGGTLTAGHLRVGDGVMAAGATGIVGDVEAGTRIAGLPHMDFALWRRVMTAMRRLPELLRRVQRIERSLDGGSGEAD